MKNLRLAIIGLDTSHVMAFTELLNTPDHPHHIPGGQVVAAFPGGSQSFSLSRNRVAQFTADIKAKFNVAITASIEEAAEQADAILLESVDGGQHLEQFRILARYKIPVFIDKPFATSRKDALAIQRLAVRRSIPVFSASAVRYAKGINECGQGRTIEGVNAHGPVAILEDYPDYFWYGVHSADVLFSKMGPGCECVDVQHHEKADIITGFWKDGRVGSIYGERIKGCGSFGCTVFTTEGVFHSAADATVPYYALLLKEVMKFFETGISPIPIAETVEIMAFLEAAGKSRKTGRPARLTLPSIT